jgi:hypothetical protein
MNRYDSLDSFLAIFWLVQETLVDPGGWARPSSERFVSGYQQRRPARQSPAALERVSGENLRTASEAGALRGRRSD